MGRAGQVERLREACEAHSLVTLVGPPGVGKTRVALEYARVALAQFVGGVWFCDLSAARGPDELLHAVAAVLDVELAQGPDRALAARQLARSLTSGGRTLFVLDNFEQLVESSAWVLHVWLEAAPSVRILVTSRRRLGFDCEQALTLGPLSLPPEGDDAYQLLAQRVSAVGGGESITGEDVPVLHEIARELDGLPLSIELAAARSSILSPTQILERLSAPFALLRRSEPPSRARRSLEDAIEWSWSLLEPWERQALAQTSVFRGGFTVEAAEAVLLLDAPSASVLDVLQSLNDKSLLVTTRESERKRFRSLMAIAEFAAIRLGDKVEAVAVRERHARFFLDLCGGFADNSQGEVVMLARDVFVCEEPNLLAARALLASGSRSDRLDALRLALSLEFAFLSLGLLSRYRELIQDSLLRVDLADQSCRFALRAQVSIANVVALLGGYDEASTLLSGVIERADAMSDHSNALRARALFAWLLARNGQLDKARAVVTSGREQLAFVAEPHTRASFLRAEGLLLLHEGLRPQAIVKLREAVASFREALALRDAAETLVLVAGRHIEEGELSRAETAAREAELSMRAAGCLQSSPSLCSIRGAIAQERGDLIESREQFEAGLEEARRTGRRAWEGTTLMRIGHLGLEAGLLGPARDAFRAARDVLQAANDLHVLALVYAGEAVVAAWEGRPTEAEDHLRAAKQLTEGLGPESRAVVEILGRILTRDDLPAQVVAEHALAKHDAKSMSGELRYAVRLLTLSKIRRFPESTAPQPATRDPGQLHVGPEALWFELDGARVDLSRRRQLRLLLLHLAHLRETAPDAQASAAELCEAAWPGEMPLASAGALRVRVALAELRKLGLRRLIVRQRGGWKLASTPPLSWERR